jgi:hypothetical protein
MSSIIDEFMRIDLCPIGKKDIIGERPDLIYELSKKINNSYGSLICHSQIHADQCATRVSNQDKEYQLLISSNRHLQILSV